MLIKLINDDKKSKSRYLQEHIKSFIIFFVLCISLVSGRTQITIPLNDFSFFQEQGPNWHIAGNAYADLGKNDFLRTTPGTGVLLNLPDQKSQAVDLLTQLQHGDVDVELDYMMAKGSNSGVYLQGRYEIQLLDSWGVKRPRSGDNGGIYERWDQARGKGKEGYEGYAPRQNVSLAPGLWQHLKISFQAPRFDATGKKTDNARILRVELNGVAIHENIELLGTTRGAMGEEAPTGPLRIQGDHGPVAFKNIHITNYGRQRPELTKLHYLIYDGKFEDEPDFKMITPKAKHNLLVLTPILNHNLTEEYIVRYTGIIKTKEQGEYNFRLNVVGGKSLLRINNQVVLPMNEGVGNYPVYSGGVGKIKLSDGEHPFELLCSKLSGWGEPALELFLSGPGIREYLISDPNNGMPAPIDPILVDASSNTVLRSFMDIPGGQRIVHAVNVGNANLVHYTYDMDKGAVVQAWRGSFLDATPMWHDRGDGSSTPVGTIKFFNNLSFNLGCLASEKEEWITDSLITAYRPKGYVLDENDLPTFRYFIYGARVNDVIRVLQNGNGLHREITVENAPANLYLLLAKASMIESLGNGVYLIDDKAYYLRMENTNVIPLVRDKKGNKELIIPIQNKYSYSIIF
jgi:3-keto-disaccharide hydrolase